MFLEFQCITSGRTHQFEIKKFYDTINISVPLVVAYIADGPTRCRASTRHGPPRRSFLVMADTVTAYIAMAYVAMAHIAMAYVAMAYIVMAEI